jgi:hypothetical protein
VRAKIDSARLKTLQVKLLHVVWGRLEDYLELLVLQQPVWVLSEPAVRRAARRLHVRDVPMRRSEDAQERLRVHRPGAHFDVERLLQQTAA